MKYILFCIIGIGVGVFAKEVEVIVANKDLSYKSVVSVQNFALSQSDDIPRLCEPLELEDLRNNQKYITTKFLQKGRIICKKDIKKYQSKKVIFSFGTLEIEAEGEIIYENEDFVRIKKPNGKIEKIYKDGMLR